MATCALVYNLLLFRTFDPFALAVWSRLHMGVSCVYLRTCVFQKRAKVAQQTVVNKTGITGKCDYVKLLLCNIDQVTRCFPCK